MRPHSRANRVAFRRAVFASVAVHALIALAVIVVTRSRDEKPTAPSIDTRAEAEPQVRMHLVEPETPVNVEPPSPNHVAAKPSDTAPPPPLPDKPFAPTPPRLLPPELTALLRKPAPDVPTRAGPMNPTVDPNVRPAANTSVAPIHGAMRPGFTVVYVLDCSGSMGAAGKFAVARDSLVASLRQQPATVRFQVIVYDGRARPLIASDGSALPATEANIRAAAEKLEALEPRGKSNHADAVRVALTFRPDVVLVLTDGDDLTAATLKSALAGAPKPAPVCVGHVTAERVQSPRELR